MKQGTTTTLSFNLKIRAIEVTDIIFRFKRKKNDEQELLKKEFSKNEAYLEDGLVKVPLSQEDTLALTKVFWIEAQIIFSNKSTTKSICRRYKMDDTLGTTMVENNQSDGNEEIIDLDFDEYVVAPADYEKIKNHPHIEGEEVVGHKTAHDYGLAKVSDLSNLEERVDTKKADKSDVSELSDRLGRDETEIAKKQNIIKMGLGLEFDQFDTDKINIKLADTRQKSFLIFSQTGGLRFNYYLVPRDGAFRQDLTDENYDNPLVSKADMLYELLSYGIKLTATIDPTTYVMTMQLKNSLNEVLSTATLDLPLETMVISGDYNAQTKKIVLTLQSGQVVEFSVADLISGLVSTGDLQEALANYQPKITAQNKLDADLINDSSSTKKLTTQQEKETWNGKQDKIDSTHKISSDLVDPSGANNQFIPLGGSNGKVLMYGTYPMWGNLNASHIDDTSTTKKFTNNTEKQRWDAKEDPTEIENDTTSTTVSLTLENNAENRYKEELADLTIILPQTIDDDFISGVVFKSGSTPTTMTYDSSIKWTGDDVNNNVFVPVADKTYNFIIWNDGININAIVRGVA